MGTKVTALSNVSNDAKLDVEILTPYMVEARIEGTSAMLFHRWSCEAVEEKANAAKGSKSKKTDNIESYIYRDEKGNVAVPSEYFRQAIIHAAKFKQDPRSPRKSAMDLFKAGIATIGELCSLGVKEPDYLDRRRVVIQRSGQQNGRRTCLVLLRQLQHVARKRYVVAIFWVGILVCLFQQFQHVAARTRAEEKRIAFRMETAKGIRFGTKRGVLKSIVIFDLNPNVEVFIPALSLDRIKGYLGRGDRCIVGQAVEPRFDPLSLRDDASDGGFSVFGNVKNNVDFSRWNVPSIYDGHIENFSSPVHLNAAINYVSTFRDMQGIFGNASSFLGSFCCNSCLLNRVFLGLSLQLHLIQSVFKLGLILLQRTRSEIGASLDLPQSTPRSIGGNQGTNGGDKSEDDQKTLKFIFFIALGALIAGCGVRRGINGPSDGFGGSVLILLGGFSILMYGVALAFDHFLNRARLRAKRGGDFIEPSVNPIHAGIQCLEGMIAKMLIGVDLGKGCDVRQNRILQRLASHVRNNLDEGMLRSSATRACRVTIRPTKLFRRFKRPLRVAEEGHRLLKCLGSFHV